MYMGKHLLFILVFADIQKIHAGVDTITKQLIREAGQVTERLIEAYPCDSCNVQLCYRQCYKMTRWAEKAKEKLAEYETAEKEGRLVVLPCKVGSTVYRILYTLAFGEIGDKAEKHYFIRETSFEYGMIDDLNETVFLTREEAEKALKESEIGNETD